MPKNAIHTDQAPAALGTYSQAVQAGKLVFVSGQVPLDPATGEIVEGNFEAQAVRSFENLVAIMDASGATPADAVKLTIFLTDLGHFATVNDVMSRYFEQPYPARAAVEVAGLPKGAMVEVDAICSIA